MPEIGNRLGPRGKYLYESDDLGTFYIVEIDQSYALPGAGDGAAAPIPYDPANPPSTGVICPPPKGFKPRVVFAKAADGRTRREIKAFSPRADLYKTSAPMTVTIADEGFTTTGRRGEKQTF